jgi:hypothetical protein
MKKLDYIKDIDIIRLGEEDTMPQLQMNEVVAFQSFFKAFVPIPQNGGRSVKEV